MKRVGFGSGLILIALLVSEAGAQPRYTSALTGRTFNNPGSALLDTMITNSMRRKLLEHALQQKRGQAAGKTVSPASSPRHPLSATDFRASGRRIMIERFAALGETAEQRSQLREACRQILTAVEAEKEFRRHNVAYALTLMIGGSLQVALGKEISEADTDRLARDLNDLLAEAAGFRQLSPVKRQALYEAAILTGGLILALHQAGTQEKDTAQLQQARSMARQVLTQVGVRLD